MREKVFFSIGLLCDSTHRSVSNAEFLEILVVSPVLTNL